MAYLNRTIRIAFDGTDEKYPTLGDDIFVTIANPMLMPASKIQPKVTVELNAAGEPVDAERALEGTMDVIAGLIVDWSVYDPTDFSDDVEKLPLPATKETAALLPVPILQAITEIMNKALNPQ